jgi:hypothetical protein
MSDSSRPDPISGPHPHPGRASGPDSGPASGPDSGSDHGRLRDWGEFDESERTRLLVEHGRWLDGLPPTCSLESKVQRLRLWLAQRGIDYRG